MLLRPALVVGVVEEPGEAPPVCIFSVMLRQSPHHDLNGTHVGPQCWIIDPFVKDVPSDCIFHVTPSVWVEVADNPRTLP